MRYDVITIGSATRDVFWKGGFKPVKDRLCFELGSKTEIEDLYFSTGGGGTNTAATFANLGFRVACLSKIGEDPGGQAVLDDLKELNVDSKFIKKTSDFHTAYSTVLSTELDRAILVYRGASQEMESKDIDFDQLEAKWFYISSVGGNLELLNSFFNYAVKKNIRLAWNPGHKELKLGMGDLKSLLSNVGVLILNLEEAKKLTGEGKISDIFGSLIKLTNGIVVVTNGMKGVDVCSNKSCFRASALGNEAVERAGAGDAFGSAFVAGLILKNDIEYAIQLATANASSVVSEIGAKNGLLRKDSLGKFEKVKVDSFKF